MSAMQRREHFGRRTAPQREIPRVAHAVARAEPAPPPSPEPAEFLAPAAEHLELYAGDADLDRELDAWKVTRKAGKRSFREPWRSFSIAAGVAFAVGPFILPDSVADIANYVTTGLFAASVIMGWRKPRD
ncbi:MAG TPA: hypothetical protein VMU01_03515 [Rhizomicrobium sp.]|nr:hypothetical protein [Rhizomicrobium sp.]